MIPSRDQQIDSLTNAKRMDGWKRRGGNGCTGKEDKKAGIGRRIWGWGRGRGGRGIVTSFEKALI